MIEDWKQALDKNEYLAAMKLKANCLSQSALEMLNSYLANRKQCVKIGQNTSDLFKMFVHDLFFFAHKCELYNYADEKVIASLEEDSKALINWFSVNKMQANPGKFSVKKLMIKIFF